MENQNEKFLWAWLRLSMTVNNAKIVPDLPYNESLIYSILYHHHGEKSEEGVTASELCRVMHMQKSQMNRTLGNMEKKGWIRRIRSEKDKRKVYLMLEPSQIEVYERQHKKILELVDAVLDRVGRERTEEMIEVFNAISNTADISAREDGLAEPQQPLER